MSVQLSTENLEVKNNKPVVRHPSVTNRVYYIVFHSPNCPNCTARMPSIKKAIKKLSDAGLNNVFTMFDFSRNNNTDVYKKIVKNIPKIYIVIDDVSHTFRDDITSDNLLRRFMSENSKSKMLIRDKTIMTTDDLLDQLKINKSKKNNFTEITSIEL